MGVAETLRESLLRTFRPARSSHRGYLYAKTLLHTGLFWTVFLLVIPLFVVELERLLGIRAFSLPTQSWSPWIAFAFFGALGLSSGAAMVFAGHGTPLPMDCANRLVVAGPYRLVRNPMAIAGLGQAAAVGVLLGSLGTLLYALVGMVVWNQLVRPIEEHDLHRRFGEQFEHYSDHVRCWVPRLTPYQPPR